MKTIIIATWALVVSAAAENVRNKGVVVSSGYGGAYGYVPTQSFKNNDPNLQSNDISSISKGADNIPYVVNAENYLPGAAISSGYGGAYGYTMTPNMVNDNRSMQMKIEKAMLAFSSAYGGAYSYDSTSNIINTELQSIVDVPNGYDRAFSFFPVPSIVSIDSGLQSDIAISSGYGGTYGYDLTASNNVNNVIPTLKSIKRPLANMFRITSAPQGEPFNKMITTVSPSQGYSGYGTGISSYSGYSRNPGFAGFGFAYANGWL